MDQVLCLKAMNKRGSGRMCGRPTGHKGYCRSKESLARQKTWGKSEIGRKYDREWHRAKWSNDPSYRANSATRNASWRNTLNGRISVLQSDMRRNTKRRGNR